MAPHTTLANDAIIPIFNMLERHKVDAFIFGCTELPLLCDGRQFEKKFNSHYVSSCDVHIESIITAMRA
jgi:aspartate/glutamate racemase